VEGTSEEAAGCGGLAVQARCGDWCGGGRHHALLFKLEITATTDGFHRAVFTLSILGFIGLNGEMYHAVLTRRRAVVGEEQGRR
jgi:hypothetical protein